MANNNRRKGRRRGAISASYCALTKRAELEHLDGLSYIHFIDVESNWKYLNPQEADAERKHAALLESYFFGGGVRFDLIGNLWFGDDLGSVSEANIMPSMDWKANVEKADDARRKWRDGDRMRTAPEGEYSGNIGKIFCRLTPWNALAAGQFLKREDVIEALLKVAISLEKETGLKVLGAVIHRETDHDIHVHFIVSKIGPVEIVEDYSPDYIKKLTTDQRKVIRKELRKRGGDSCLKAVNEELARRRKEGIMKDPTDLKTIEYQTLDRTKAPRRGITNMGQQYCSKTNLWEASGRDPAVAAVQERHCKVSFRSIVQDAAKVAPNGDPAHKYLDYWLAQKWNQAISKLLPEEIQEQMPEVARLAALRYVEEGSSLPNPALDAAREKENQIIFAAARAASGIKKMAEAEAETIITEAQTRLRDTQMELENTLARCQERDAYLEKTKVAATTMIEHNELVRNQLDEREKTLASRESILYTGEKNLSEQQINLKSLAQIVTVEMEELKNERTRLRRIPVALVAEKMGFVPADDGTLKAKLFDHTKTEFEYRILFSSGCFKVEAYHHLKWGSWDWVTQGDGKSAIDFMRTFVQYRSIQASCNRLAELFPEAKAGIILELLEASNPDTWKDLSQQEPTQAPSHDLGPDPKPDTISSPEEP
jgi:hypothetical protein